MEPPFFSNFFDWEIKMVAQLIGNMEASMIDIWKAKENGIYTVKSCYKILNRTGHLFYTEVTGKLWQLFFNGVKWVITAIVKKFLIS